MMTRIFLLSTLLSLPVLIGCGSANPKTESSTGPTTRVDSPSPQVEEAAIRAVFENVVATQKKKDNKAHFNLLTPEAQKDLAAGRAAGAMHQQRASQGNDEGSKRFREDFKLILATLDKHGLTYEATSKITLARDENEFKKAVNELIPLIKDPLGLYLDLEDAYSKTPPFNGERPPMPEVKLSDIHIEGDKATGMVTVMMEGKEMRHPTRFVKIEGTWKADPRP